MNGECCNVWVSSRLERQPDIILRERAPRQIGRQQILQVGVLQLVLVGAVGGKAMQQRRHPPGEALRLPHPRQRPVRIAVEPGIVTVAIVIDEAVIEIIDVGGRAVQPARALTDLIDASRSLRLEIAIVALIVIEVIFTFYEFFKNFKWG